MNRSQFSSAAAERYGTELESADLTTAIDAAVEEANADGSARFAVAARARLLEGAEEEWSSGETYTGAPAGHPPINGQVHAGDLGGLVRGEIQYTVGHIRGLAEPPDGLVCGGPLQSYQA